MCKEGRKIVVEMVIKVLEVVLEVRSKIFEVIEDDFLKVLFNDGEYSR